MTWQQWSTWATSWINRERADLAAHELRISNLEKGELKMSKQVDDLKTALDAFEAEVATDVGALLAGQTALNQKITDLTAQVAAGGTMSTADATALSSMTADLLQRTTDLHAKVTTAPTA